MLRGRSRGVIQVWLLYLGGAAVASQLVPNWRISALFAKAPPTAELRAAEDAAAKAQAEAVRLKSEADSANAKLAAAQSEQAKIHQQQGAYAQGATAGAAEALSKVPADHLTPEVRVAASLVDRAQSALDSAFGRLPPEQVAYWKKLTDDALAAKGQEITALTAALATKDAALQAANAEKAVLAVKVPILEAQATAAVAKADTAQIAATTKAQEAAGLAEQVAAAADKLLTKEKEAGSFSVWLTRVLWGACLLVAGILFCNFILPSLAAEFPAVSWLVKLNKATKSISSSHP